jgi:16S rRNA (guanine966-N2)-methyltransferase
MRVISGTAGRLKLRTADLPHLRPMLDRVKEALFNILRDEVAGAAALDLFSGVGGLGIEALSRGAASCTFVERDGRLVDILRENLARCRLEQRARVVQADVMRLPGRRPPREHTASGLVFADPPYAMVDDPNRRAELFRTLEALAGDWIAGGATLVLHHAPLPYALWPVRAMNCFDRRVYGRSQLSFFRVPAEGPDEA